MKNLFIGNYFDGDSDNYLLFVADSSYAYGKNADKRNDKLKGAFKSEYGCDIDDEDIHGVFPIIEAYDYDELAGFENYEIKLVRKEK